MKRFITGAAMLFTLGTFAPVTFAADAEPGFHVWADVVKARPIMTTRYDEVPTTHCRIVKNKGKSYRTAYYAGDHDDNRRYSSRHHDNRQSDNRQSDNALPTLFGGVLGGVIGNQFGRGNGKRAMTVIGAIAGASIANAGSRDQNEDHWDEYSYRDDRSHRSNRSHKHASARKVCNTSYEVEEVEEISGYDVTYRYLGREFTKVTDEHPGKKIRLYVTIEPANPKYI